MHFQVDFLVVLDVEDGEGRAAGVDHRKHSGVGGIVVAKEWAIVHGKAVLPKMQDAFDGGSAAALA